MTIDRVFLGMYSTEALGAAMAVMGVFWVPMALLQQTSSYVTAFVAQYLGAKEYQKISQAFWQAAYVSVVGGLGFLLLNFLSDDFFRFVDHAPKVQALEVEYFNSVAYSALPTALVGAISGVFTGLGNTRAIIWINLVGLVLNVILDYLLIFGNFGFPALGVAGAGYATAIATLVAAGFGLWLLFRERPHPEVQWMRGQGVNRKLMASYLKFGLPSGLQWALEGLAFTVFLIIIGRMPNGEAGLASSSIAVTVMMLSVLPSMGVAQAVMSLVGQCLGDAKPDQAERYVWTGVRITAVYIFFVAVTFVLVPDFYLSWFRNDENPALWAETAALAAVLFRIVAGFTLFDSLYLNFSFALKGAGDTRFVSLIALLVPWPLMVAPAYLVSEWPNAVVWAWSFTVVYSVAITSILLWRFRQGRWKTMSVIR